MKGSDEKLSNDSKKQSISQSQLKDHPLMKQDILQVYSDVFTVDREVSRNAIQIPIKGKCKTHQACTKESAYTVARCFPQ